MNSRPRMQIIRGLPGSGKSTLALSTYPSLLRLETDMLFTSGGRYSFTKQSNVRAIRWFERTVADCTLEKMDLVVTGVFTAHTERMDYCVQTALSNGYVVYIKTLESDYGTVHGVPPSHMVSMRENFVSEMELRKRYRGNHRVHFGLMPSDVTVVSGGEKR